jgi:hemerythrin-like metal-binding protein
MRGGLMIIQWDESISVHNDALDSQHKKFIKLLNSLDELSEGRGAITRDVIVAIEFLEDYARTHFAYEEKYFINHNFPESTQHHEEHAKFLRAVAVMRQELSSKGATLKLANDISKFMADWLLTHVRNIDHRYSAFIETGQLPPKNVFRKFH